MNNQKAVTKVESKEIKELLDSIFDIDSKPKKVEKKIREWTYGVLYQSLKDLKALKDSVK